MIQTKNFNSKSDPKLLCTCGHPECDKRSVSQETLDQVQLVREDFGGYMVITSGGRCPNHPNEKTKARPGDHQKCFAVDVACSSLAQETKLKVLGGRHGATRVAGTHKDGFIHLAWTPTKDKSVPTWSY
tara:strand:+ start:415 stop:801 length:387 start_codon:yes stop_codon:yes gene_type:complete